MKYSDQSYNLRIELDTKSFELSPAEIEQIEGALDPLREPAAKFPVSDLYLTVERHTRSGRYRVKAVLQLPGRGLATGSVHPEMYPAVQQSVRRLVHKLLAYQDQLENAEDRTKHQKGTRQDVVAEREVDPQEIDRALAEQDYATFRKLMFVYEEPLRKRIGRWIERYPQVEAKLLAQVSLNDVVEEIFLTAFEEYSGRPQAVPYGTWLESFIDPSVKRLSTASDEELDNISFARTLWEEA